MVIWGGQADCEIHNLEFVSKLAPNRGVSFLETQIVWGSCVALVSQYNEEQVLLEWILCPGRNCFAKTDPHETCAGGADLMPLNNEWGACLRTVLIEDANTHTHTSRHTRSRLETLMLK